MPALYATYFYSSRHVYFAKHLFMLSAGFQAFLMPDAAATVLASMPRQTRQAGADTAISFIILFSPPHAAQSGQGH